MATVNPVAQQLGKFGLAERFVTKMAGRSIAPFMVLECFVIGGRTYQAYKRGGFIESRERFMEEGLGAVFWYGGVNGFNKLGDKIGPRLLKVADVNFDVGKDNIRNPIHNYKLGAGKALTEKQIGMFKFGKIAIAVLMANALMGFVEPKANQAITRYILRKRSSKQENGADIAFSSDKFTKQKNDQKNNSNKQTQNPSFKGGGVSLISLANSFENSQRVKLLSTEVGVDGGRALCARNKHERVEGLIRDLGSTFFYMACVPLTNAGLNQLQTGKTSRLNPISARLFSEKLQEILNHEQHNGKMSVAEFEKVILGNEAARDKKMTAALYKSFTTTPKTADDHQTIKLSDFLEHVKNDTKAQELAKDMAQLQPEFEGHQILTRKQVGEIFQRGEINDPKLLANIYNLATEGAYNDKTKFVAYGELTSINDNMEIFVREIIDKAKKTGSDVTVDMVKKACKDNFRKNALNWGAGFAIAGLFLSTIIPKIQYAVTRKRTGQNSFPGVTDYSNEQGKGAKPTQLAK